MNTCYCDGYGICLGGRQKFDDFFKLQDERNAQFVKFEDYQRREKKAREENNESLFNETDRKIMTELNVAINAMDDQLNQLRQEALKRGEDPKARKEETETYDNSHIWEYAPHGGQ